MSVAKTFRGVLSASVSNLANLPQVKQEIYKLFEQERSKMRPEEFFVINDGIVFRIENDEDYNEWSRKTEKYVLNRIQAGKIITITVFVS